MGAGSVNSVTGTSASAPRMNVSHVEAGRLPPVTPPRTPLMLRSGRGASE